MNASDPTAAPPVILGGRYEVHRRLARGGMAEVYLARDQALDRPVAVKVLFPEFAADPAFVERFRREAQAAANLTHPNIVGVYDWGNESGTYYIVMEYVEGQSLSEVVRDSGPLQPRRAAEIIFEVAGALGAAHRHGVVHRDVKPGNVLLSTAGVAKVTDFGIARALSSPTEELTQAGSVMGTATYFSPEQAQGFPVDARGDLYSLGVVLYEILCGRPPFVGETPVAIAYQHVQEWPPRPSQFVSGVPAGLESVILKLLAKKPEQRYLSADDLRADLRRFLDGQTTLAEQEQARATAAAAGVVGSADPDATTVQPSVQATAPNATTAMPAVSSAPVPPPTSIGPGSAGPPTSVGEPMDLDDEEPPQRTGLFVAVTVVLLAALAGLGFWLVSSLNDDGSGDEIAVTNVVDRTEEEAVSVLRDQGFNPIVKDEASETVVKGLVIRQDPAAGEKLAKDSDVTIFVSIGTGKAIIPTVKELSEQEARRLLVDSGFEVSTEQAESVLPVGTAVETVPPEGTEVDAASKVTLRISAGPGNTTVPNLQGKSVAEATKALTDLGFVIGASVTEASDTVPRDLVIRTDPSGEVAKFATIALVVSSGPESVKVPSVVGQRESDAKTQIQAQGFEVVVVARSLPEGDADDGRVVEVSPSAGTMAKVGSTVKIFVGVASKPTTTTTAPRPTTTVGSSTTVTPTTEP